MKDSQNYTNYSFEDIAYMQAMLNRNYLILRIGLENPRLLFIAPIYTYSVVGLISFLITFLLVKTFDNVTKRLFKKNWNTKNGDDNLKLLDGTNLPVERILTYCVKKLRGGDDVIIEEIFEYCLKDRKKLIYEIVDEKVIRKLTKLLKLGKTFDILFNQRRRYIVIHYFVYLAAVRLSRQSADIAILGNTGTISVSWEVNFPILKKPLTVIELYFGKSLLVKSIRLSQVMASMVVGYLKIIKEFLVGGHLRDLLMASDYFQVVLGCVGPILAIGGLCFALSFAEINYFEAFRCTEHLRNINEAQRQEVNRPAYPKYIIREETEGLSAKQRFFVTDKYNTEMDIHILKNNRKDTILDSSDNIIISRAEPYKKFEYITQKYKDLEEGHNPSDIKALLKVMRMKQEQFDAELLRGEQEEMLNSFSNLNKEISKPSPQIKAKSNTNDLRKRGQDRINSAQVKTIQNLNKKSTNEDDNTSKNSTEFISLNEPFL